MRYVFLFARLLGVIELSNCATTETLLAKAKMVINVYQGYDSMSLPHNVTDDTTNIRLGYALTGVKALDAESHSLTTTALLCYWWKDDRLKWSENVANLTTIRLGNYRIWTPDIVPWGASYFTEGVSISPLRVHNTGDVEWCVSRKIVTVCKPELDHFPHDIHQCYIKIGVWGDSEKDVRLTSWEHASLGYWEDFGEWRARVAEVKGMIDEQASKNYSIVSIDIQLRRRTSHYTQTITVPIVSVVFLTIFSVFIPQEFNKARITINFASLYFIVIITRHIAYLVKGSSMSVPLTMYEISIFGAVITMNLLSALFRSFFTDLPEENPLTEKILQIPLYLDYFLIVLQLLSLFFFFVAY